MLYLNEVSSSEGDKERRGRSSVIKLVVYNRPILAAVWGGRDQGGVRETTGEAAAVIPREVTETSQHISWLMTSDVEHGSREHIVATAQRMTALGISLQVSQFGTGSWRQHGTVQWFKISIWLQKTLLG